MDIKTLIVGLVTGLLSGIGASVLFTVLSRCFKPQIVIADKISKTYEDGLPVYRIKFVNLSKHYAKNIHITAQFIDHINADNESGIIVQTRPLKFVRKDFQFVNPFDKTDSESRYAVRLRFQDNVEKLWKDPNHSSLEFVVYCENEMNGAGKVFKKVYRMPSSISEGTYDTGKSTSIITSQR